MGRIKGQLISWVKHFEPRNFEGGGAPPEIPKGRGPPQLAGGLGSQKSTVFIVSTVNLGRNGGGTGPPPLYRTFASCRHKLSRKSRLSTDVGAILKGGGNQCKSSERSTCIIPTIKKNKEINIFCGDRST